MNFLANTIHTKLRLRYTVGFPGGVVVKNSPANAGDIKRHAFDPGWEDPLEWKPTLEFLPGKSHGQRSLASYSPWGRKELYVTEHTL